MSKTNRQAEDTTYTCEHKYEKNKIKNKTDLRCANLPKVTCDGIFAVSLDMYFPSLRHYNNKNTDANDCSLLFAI